ncbi:MAG: RNA polymerase sigma factor WhiG [Rubrobacteridae bacterium]|nr:RNA polymerase sigma factor WhiG [Rubrobacteridae bacterium]
MEAKVEVQKEVDISTLWQVYKTSDCQDTRDRLILHYSPLVKYIAGRISASLPQSVDHADLVSYGIFGLIDAIEKYDTSREIKFETYAINRIKGAIIDELRALDWVPRSVRYRARELERVYYELENTLHRVPTDKEVADAMGITVNEHNDLLSQLSYTSVLALEELWSVGEKDDKVSLIDSIEDTSSPDPAQTFEFEEIKDILADAIRKLPEREKTVIALYYYDGLTLREIGEILGVTESRVSQLHTKAVLRLKAKMRSAQILQREK